jgi:4-hydroxybenzoate polyprenyltransferase
MPSESGGVQMKNLLRITAILNLLIVVLAFICVVIGAITKNYHLLAPSVALVLISIFPAAMMLALCNDFKDGKR